MRESLLLGIGRHMVPIPRFVWHRLVKSAAKGTRARLRFMSEDHHRVRDYAVLELARAGAPLTPEAMSGALDLSLDRVTRILDDLERHLTFLYRRDGVAVDWAYPVTVEETPHRARFSTGEEAYSP